MKPWQAPASASPIARLPPLASVQAHPGYARVLQRDRLTFGLIAPLEGYPDAPWPTSERHPKAARQGDATDMTAIWLRNVPFYDPSFGDTGQVVDPMVYAGWLAGQTGRIAIGTAGIISPLRDPLIVAKQAVSLDRLTDGRFILDLATGDRPFEFAVFDLISAIGWNAIAMRWRDPGGDRAVVPAAPVSIYGTLDMLPKPVARRLPVLAIGRAGQNFNWLSRNTGGWIWHLSNPNRLLR
jgi:luciferase-type oxidoreductase